LLSYTIHTTGPLATITERADTLNTMWALESRDEKVPWRGEGLTSEQDMIGAH
jgi:hypothetical protein